MNDLDILIELEGGCEHEYDTPTKDIIDRMQSSMGRAHSEIEHLRRVLNTPELHDFSAAVALEAAHQRERWPEGHDACKTTAEWIQLCVHLLGKAINADWEGDVEKLKHHIITTGAALNNFHSQILGWEAANQGSAKEQS